MSLVLTLGDPAGIGPEIVLKALVHHPDLTVVGDREVLHATHARLRAMGQVVPELDAVKLIDCGVGGGFVWGEGTAATGDASFIYLCEAIRRTQAGEFRGIVTAPIAKYAWHAAGHYYPGQTEVLAEAADTGDYGMVFLARSPHTGWPLCVMLATTHIPLAQVPTVLTPALVERKLYLLQRFVSQDLGIDSPQITVAGLNPHSGENGQLGTEERDWLKPLLERLSFTRGPVPPDTLWIKPAQAWWHDPAQGATAYLALYHDQGLIPVKMLAFDQAVNTTIGLPFCRTSPDHGTAFDIAGQGLAQPQSLLAAIDWALTLTRSNTASKPDATTTSYQSA